MDLITAVRKRPGMYFGDTRLWEGANAVIYEIISNSVDLFLINKVSKIDVKVDGYRIDITDDGPGLPFDEPAPDTNFSNLAEYYLLCPHHTATADNHAPHIHIKLGGLGLAPLTAAAEKMTVESYNGQKFWSQEFRVGQKEGEAKTENHQAETGTRFILDLDRTIFYSPPNQLELRKILFETAHLFPGLSIRFDDTVFFSRNGLLDLGYLHLERTSRGETRTFRYHAKHKDIEFQVAALGESDKGTMQFMSWANGIQSIDGGSHVIGLSNALAANNWSPELALVHVIMHDPRYASPTKDRLKMKEVEHVIENTLTPIILTSNQAQNKN